MDFPIWGAEGIDDNTIAQMTAAADLPVSVAAALMPDAHLGYGLPIGGVLALDNAVMPYGVGNDIACRMMLTVLNVYADALDDHRSDLREAIDKSTKFGVGCQFDGSDRRQHPVMDEDWSFLEGIVDKDKAWAQLGTSGSGNHFIDVGELRYVNGGGYTAILTHSGSRGMGSKIATHFTRLAKAKHPELEGEDKNLAWLSLDDEDGQLYWKAMELAGRYASANHHCIHDRVIDAISQGPELGQHENHHNFAWKEEHFGKEVVVHRKGATPAGLGEMGIIPGSMTAPGYLVRGKGGETSMCSAAHGAGRAMSRKKAKGMFTRESMSVELKASGVDLMGSDVDEAPGAYKDIDEVMRHQKDLVEVVATFTPKIVKMAG